MIKTIFVISIIGILSGCVGESDSSTSAEKAKTQKERVADQEASGAIPKLNRDNSIAGTDTNANGVRDDVEAFITSNYTSSIQRAAAMQTARALQHALTVDTTDKSAVKVADQEISKGINCIYSKFDGTNGSKRPAQVLQELESITTNTKQRLLAYLRFNKALDGTTSALTDGDTCEPQSPVPAPTEKPERERHS
jgi:hypothetical protein